MSVIKAGGPWRKSTLVVFIEEENEVIDVVLEEGDDEGDKKEEGSIEDEKGLEENVGLHVYFKGQRDIGTKAFLYSVFKD